jgi:predicted Zn-dependent protease
MPIAKKILTRRQLLHFLGIGTASYLSLPLLSGCAIDPVTGKKQFMMMSESEEINLDKKQSPLQFSTDYGPLQDQLLNQYINRIGLELANRSHRPHMPFTFRGVNASYINAYAFPGGSIAVTRGILVELENEAELAALLGHEIGHVCARHTAEQSGKGMLTSLLLTGASVATSAAGYGGAADLVQSFGQLGAGALLAHYSRDNEREADSLGMEYMTRTGYNPSGMVGLMQVLLQNNKHKPSAVEVMFSTHPMSEDRLAWAKKAAKEKYSKLHNAPVHKERFMDMTTSLRKNKTAISLMQKGATAMAKGKYGTAEQTLRTVLQKMPDDYTGLVMMGKCQFALENTRKAVHYASRAAQIYPQEAQAHLIIGVSEIVNQRYDQAYQHLSTFDNLLPGNPEITFFRGVAKEGLGERQEAAQYYRGYIQRVKQGQKAQYAYNRLKTWGYAK